jgi:hypothetical protein
MLTCLNRWSCRDTGRGSFSVASQGERGWTLSVARARDWGLWTSLVPLIFQDECRLIFQDMNCTPLIVKENFSYEIEGICENTKIDFNIHYFL